jgi:hypothetical protein
MFFFVAANSHTNIQFIRNLSQFHYHVTLSSHTNFRCFTTYRQKTECKYNIRNSSEPLLLFVSFLNIYEYKKVHIKTLQEASLSFTNIKFWWLRWTISTPHHTFFNKTHVMSTGDGGTSRLECFVIKVYRMYINTQNKPSF